VNAFGFKVSTNASGLDVDNGCGSHGDGVGSSGGRDNRLVEAHRCRDFTGEEGVVTQIVLSKRLLDQQQVEGIELAQVRGVDEPVGAIRIYLQRDIAKALAHCTDGLDVPAWLDLELDAHVTLVDIAAYRR
jgi:hypothetical protein